MSSYSLRCLGSGRNVVATIQNDSNDDGYIVEGKGKRGVALERRYYILDSNE